MRDNIFGKRLRMLRKEKGYNETEFADLTSISISLLSRYENGERVPNIEYLNEITDIFDVSSDFLLGKTNLRKPKIVLAYKFKSNKGEKRMNYVENCDEYKAMTLTQLEEELRDEIRKRKSIAENKVICKEREDDEMAISKLIKDTTREQRQKIINEGMALNSLDGAAASRFARDLYNEYIDGNMELEDVRTAIIESYREEKDRI